MAAVVVNEMGTPGHADRTAQSSGARRRGQSLGARRVVGMKVNDLGSGPD